MASSLNPRTRTDPYDYTLSKRVNEGTIDPTSIRSPSEIPPANAQFVGSSSPGIVDIYCGTIPGDVDALPAAKELIGTAPDTGGLSNADYVYNQLSRLYGGTRLPSFQSPSGTSVVSVVFVSGSSQGGYGAFHINGTQTDFDRIVLDSLTVTGGYSPGSGLGLGAAHVTARLPHLFPIYRGRDDLHGIFHKDDPRLKTAKTTSITAALAIAAQTRRALKTLLGSTKLSATAPKDTIDLSAKNNPDPGYQLVHANQDILGLLSAISAAAGSRHYLSTALFTAEIVECFQKLTGKADPARTDGEAVSRVLAYKLAPEITVVPGFNSLVIQQWWKDGAPDFVNVNTENDQSVDGNGAGVMFLEFLTDYLGVAFDEILQRMPSSRGAPLGQTYQNLLTVHPELAQTAGPNGQSAFQKMVSLLKQAVENPDGTLNLPADGNPFRQMPGPKQGGLFHSQTPTVNALGQDIQRAVGLAGQFDQQFIQFKATLQQVQSRASTSPANEMGSSTLQAAFGYRSPLPAALSLKLERQVQADRAPQYDQSLQTEFWPHVYNELLGTGPNTDRLQVITGTNQVPLAIRITGTIGRTKLEPDGDLHIYFQPDDPNFPTNQGAGESPLELEIIYAGPVTQQDAKQAEKGYTNPFDISSLTAGARILVTGPLIFDRAHGMPTPDGSAVAAGLEIHPIVGLTILSAALDIQATAPTGQVSNDVSWALGQIGALSQTLNSLNTLLQEMQREAQTG